MNEKKTSHQGGGRILTLSEDNAAADTHDSLSSDDKGNTLSSDEQGMGEESSPQENSHEEKPDKPSGKKPRKKKKKAEEGEMSAEEFEDAFNSLNAGDAATEALGKRVLAHYAPGKNRIELNAEKFNSVRLGDETKAQCMVHEMIHAVTCWAMHMAKENPAALTESQLAAVRDIEEVYEAIKDDGAVRAALRTGTRVEENAEYGLTSAEEMIAELANPAFRAALKAKQLFRQLINGVKRLLGINVTGSASQTDAAAVLENALDTLLNEFDQDVYRDYTDLAAMGHARETFDMSFAESEEEFEATRDKAIAENGSVMPGLREKVFNVVEVSPMKFIENFRHSFDNIYKPFIKALQSKRFNIIDSEGRVVSVGLNHDSIRKLSAKDSYDETKKKGRSDRPVYFAVLNNLGEVLSQAIEVEVHPDKRKDENHKRGNNGEGTEKLVHRYYAVVRLENSNKLSRVLFTILENKDLTHNTLYSQEVIDIEIKGELSDKSDSSSTGILGAESDSLRSLGVAKVLQGVEKSYDPGKFVLDESAELRLPEENQASAEDEPEENGRADTTLTRQGTGEKTADDVARAADLWTKAWGPEARTPAQRRRFAREERRRMRARAESIAAKLGLDNV
ncbi:MAG: hypothetical protein K2M67_08680, partial [Muribaculaceae bacterium]|nr:hypothetical protein [Muribaculaceae bacterium]